MIGRLVSLFGISLLMLAAGKTGSVLARVILVREMAQAEFGQFSIALVVIPLAATIGLLGLHKGIVREFPRVVQAGDASALRGLVIVPLALALSVCFLISAALYALHLHAGVAIVPDMDSGEMLLLCLAIPGYALVVYASCIFWAAGYGRLYLFGEQTSFPLLFLATVTALALLDRMSLAEALGAYMLSSWVIGGGLLAFALIRCRRQLGWSSSSGRRLRAPGPAFFVYSGTLLLSGLAYVALGSVDRLLLGQFVPLDDVALYSVAYTVAALVPILLVMADAQATPRIAAAFARADIRELESAYVATNRHMLLLATPACAGLLVLHPWVLAIFGDGYGATGALLLVLLLGEYVNVLSGVSGRVLQMGGQERFEVNLTVTVLVAYILMNLVLIPLCGVIGAAFATCAMRVMHGMFKALRVRRIWGIGFWWPRVPVREPDLS